ncbi:MAG TPA: methyl-accepting chemotaxis protein [Arenicellales bacterium]|nr:methyl-accepting chemotaxis protein [Arenicellales bacterium]
MATAQDSLNEDFNTSRRGAPPPLGGGDPLDMVIEADPSGASESSRGEEDESAAGLPLIITVIIVAIIGLVVFQTLESRRSAGQAEFIERASSLLMLSQAIAKDARQAALGEAGAFDSLRGSRDQFANVVTTLDQGDPTMNMPATPVSNREAFQQVQSVWERTRRNVDSILEQEPLLLTANDAVERINQLAPALLARSDEVVEAVIRESGDPALVNLAGRQRTLSQRIASNINVFSKGGAGASMAATQFGKDTNTFARTMEELRGATGPAVHAKLDALEQTFGEFQSSVNAILETVAEFFVAQRASQAVLADSDPLLESSEALIAGFSQPVGILQYLPWAFGVLAVLGLFWLGRHLVVEARKQAEVSAEQNRETQDAILKLLDEMGSLADGDLTIEAEVTDQITGAIADSINFAVQEMRDLVARINTATAQVTSESESTANIARELSRASAAQADEITKTTAQVQAMSSSMQEMSGDARRSAEVAQSSVDVAKRGAQAVRDTIRGMDDMREQIQETSKRIKRLGESSQQIGEIVSLIDEIAEQTNILSLNASIQAAMAGEAGRGFAVVADEVQRLAERSAEATKQISTLVSNIQTDTNEAVTSMEHATQGVVDGTRLADSAGQALGEIESVSEELSRLITGMADTAERQSEEATTVSSRMTSIRDVTHKTSQGAQTTAQSIGKLSELARELHDSVSGFKLPA